MSASVALVIVADSSETIADSWRHIWEYLHPLVQRLALLSASQEPDGKPNVQIGYVCYGTADARPTPIVCKQFFTAAQQAITGLKGSPRIHGIGSSRYVRGNAMAVLEGLAAAIELLDDFRANLDYRDREPLTPHDVNAASTPKAAALQPLASHIIHIAACSPDNTDTPQWNRSPELDNLSWNTLPTELRNRNLHWSSILVKSDISRISECQVQTSPTGPVKPWFNIQPHHRIHLYGFPETVQPHKRSVGAPASPESKRPRLDQSSGSQSLPMTSTPVAPAAIPAATVPPLHPVKTESQPEAPAVPATQAQSTPKNQQISSATAFLNSLNNLPPDKRQTALQYGRQKHVAAMEIQKKMQLAEQAGKKELVAELKRQFDENIQYSKLVSLWARRFAGQLLGSVNASVTNQPSQPATQGPPAQADKPTGTDMNMMNVRAVPPGPMNQMTPELYAQMQKMLDQRRNAAGQPQLQTQVNNVPAPSLPNVFQPTAGPSSTSQAPQQGQTRPGSNWFGTLRWSGVDSTAQKKDLSAEVIVSAHAELRTELWPNQLQLAPGDLATNELSAWFKRVNGVICQARGSARTIETSANERAIQMLMDLLMSRSLFAFASWPNRINTQLHCHLVFFVIPGNVDRRLVAAFFQSPNQMPQDLPRARMPAIDLSKLPPKVLEQLSKASPEQRPQMLKVILARQEQFKRMAAAQQQQQRQQQQQQQQGQQQMLGQQMAHQNMQTPSTAGLNQFMASMGGPSNPPANPNMNASANSGLNLNNMQMFMNAQMGNAGMGNMNAQVQQQLFNLNGMNSQMGQMNQIPQGMGTAPPGFSDELLQSFMQRNMGGASGSG